MRGETDEANDVTTGKKTVALTTLDLRYVDQEWNVARKDASVSGKPLRIGGREFARGIGTHAPSDLLVRVGRKAERFRATVGADENAEGKGSVRFTVEGDGKTLWQSPVLRTGDAPVAVDVDIRQVRLLKLSVEDGGDGMSHDHADWADARLEGVTGAPVALSRNPDLRDTILPNRLWCDESGNQIQAHGGGILRHGNRWWWHGEDRSNGYVAIGVSAYSSDDLTRWRHEGVVLPHAEYSQKHGDQNICERPKVIYNPRTGRFVLWFHYDRSGYGDSQAGVAVASRPQGPFRFLGAHRPVPSATFRDMNLFVDDDNAAYVFYASENNATLHVVRLNEDWTAPQAPMVEGKTWARVLVNQWREAPAPFKHAGKYWLITSGCTGWDANPADIAVADSPLGPYQSLGNPCVGAGGEQTFGAQSTFVLPRPKGKPGEFIFLADRWKKEALADARYLWLPFRMPDKIGERGAPSRPEIAWTGRWKVS